MNGTVALIVIAVLLIPLAGLFAAADAALNSVSRARVEALVRAGRPARALAVVVADRPRYVNLLLLLRLAAEMAATVLLTIALIQIFDRDWAGGLTAGGIMLVVSYVLIGVGPRTLGRQHPYRVGMLVAAPIRALATLLGPLTKLLIVVGNAITPGQGFRQGPFSSEVELRELVDMASTSGVVDEDERQMIHSVFELGDTLVREVMVPRPDVLWTERDTPIDKVVRLALKSGLLPHPGARREHRRHHRRRLPEGPRRRAGGTARRPARRTSCVLRRSCPTPSGWTSCSRRCRPRATTWRSSWTSTAARRAW